MTYTRSQAQAARTGSLSVGGPTGVTGTEAFTAVGEVSEAPFKSGEWKFDDTTNFQSGVDDEQLPTTRSPGSVSLTGNRVSSDAGQALVETAYLSGVLYDFKLTMPLTKAQTTTGDVYAFTAFVKNSSFSFSVKNVIKMSVDLELTGPRTLTLGS